MAVLTNLSHSLIVKIDNEMAVVLLLLLHAAIITEHLFVTHCDCVITVAVTDYHNIVLMIE
jgi:hypothetical protein